MRVTRTPSSWVPKSTVEMPGAAVAMAAHAHAGNGKANGNGHDHSVTMDQFVRF
jgi:hypothetical protein